MRSLTTVCCVSWLALAGALAVACSDDSSSGTNGGGGDGNAAGSGEPTDGGTSSSGATSNSGGTSSMAGSGEGGEVGSLGGSDPGVGGEPAGGGAPTGEGGSAGEGGDPVDPNLCENFPVTITGGPTIQVDVTGAILCLNPCRVTDNTYSDACGNSNNEALRFFMEAGQAPSNYANMPEAWTWESASAGTIDQDFPNYLNDVPGETEITAVVSAPDQTEYAVVFSFPGDGQITITSFAEN